MILDRLEQAQQYLGLDPRFPKAFEFLRRPDLADLAPGRHEIDNDDLYALVVKGTGQPKDQVKLESHRKYIDIQFVVAGLDEMGWRNTASCANVAQPFDAESDVELFSDPVSSWLSVQTGHFTIFFPEDAHAPGAGPGEFHKVVLKIKIK